MEHRIETWCWAPGQWETPQLAGKQRGWAMLLMTSFHRRARLLGTSTAIAVLTSACSASLDGPRPAREWSHFSLNDLTVPSDGRVHLRERGARLTTPTAVCVNPDVVDPEMRELFPAIGHLLEGLSSFIIFAAERIHRDADPPPYTTDSAFSYGRETCKGEDQTRVDTRISRGRDQNSYRIQVSIYTATGAATLILERRYGWGYLCCSPTVLAEANNPPNIFLEDKGSVADRSAAYIEGLQND